MRPALNPLVMHVKESATLAINLKARQLRQQGTNIVHWGFGQSPFPVPEIIQQALREHTDKHDYLPTQGLPELCDAVASFYQQQFGYTFSGSEVCIGPGSKELIFQIIYLMEGPLLVPAPSWVSYGPQAALRGKQMIPIQTERDNRYKLTPAQLDKACYQAGQSQKLLIFNNPSNPTGAVYHQQEIQELAEICRAYQVVVISDEIYAMLEFNQQPMSSLASYYPEGTIVSGGLSKSFAAGGYRLGLVLIPQALDPMMATLKSVVSETFSAVSAPIQYAALAAYTNVEAIKPFIQTSSEIYRFVMHYMHQRFIDMGLNCPKPEGSFYLFPDFDNYQDVLKSSGILTSHQLMENILEQSGVALLPGSDFYMPATSLSARVAAVDFDGPAVLNSWPGYNQLSSCYFDKNFSHIEYGCDQLERYLVKL